MSRLGLRAKEVSRLQLDDFDWRLGTILIRAGKTHCERLLPLDEQVGQAVVEYLRDGRPVSSHREVFLTNDAPYQPLQTASAITQYNVLTDERTKFAQQVSTTNQAWADFNNTLDEIQRSLSKY